MLEGGPSLKSFLHQAKVLSLYRSLLRSTRGKRECRYLRVQLPQR